METENILLRVKSPHQQRVETMLAGIPDRPIPNSPQPPDNSALLLTWARLLVEETLEAVEASGVSLHLHLLDGDALKFEDLRFRLDKPVEPAGLPALAKELCDVRVVATGYMSICGIADESPQAAVDANNIMKIHTGRNNPETGKFEKDPNHPKVPMHIVLEGQGFSPNPKNL